MIINGIGAIYDYEPTTLSTVRSTSPFAEDSVNSNTIKKVIIEEGITSIGKLTFPAIFDCSEYYLPNSIEYIDPEAFGNPEKYTFYCYSDSYSYQFAKENNIEIKLLK